MKSLLKTLAVVAVAVPAVAFAAITGSKHDLSSTNTGVAVHSTGANATDQICIFCHAPHKAFSQALIWNHKAGTVTGFTAGQYTVGGTTLPTTVQAPSMACLNCHDGTVALGDVNSTTVANGGAGIIGVTTVANHTNATGMLIGYALVGNGTSLNGNHPVSIPYAGATYNGIPSGISSGNVNGNYTAVNSSCTGSPSGICITAGANTLPLFKVVGADTGGVECGSCHDVHNKLNNTYFLRVTATGSAICLACHIK